MVGAQDRSKMEQLKNFIAGEFVTSKSGDTMPVYAPATGEQYTSLTCSDSADVEIAVEHSRAASQKWSALDSTQRAEYLERIAAGIEKRFEQFVQVESQDTGKPLSLARKVDIPRAVANFRFFAHAATQFTSQASELGRTHLSVTVRDPVGIAGCISPWNLPLYLFSWKIAPALASGNCVIAKPSELTPATASMLGEVAVEAGLPTGVLNILHGRGVEVGAAIVANESIKAISFTGGTATGRAIANSTASSFKKLSLELGGKNATIVFADAEFESAVNGAVRAGFTNQGEICLCGSRILVQEEIYAKFRESFVTKVKALRVGDPLEESTDQGAVISRGHQEKILSMIASAENEGGKILCGGQAAKVAGRCAKGWFVNPTVIDNLSPTCSTNQNEIFGPVVSLIPFKTQEEAIEIANSTRYGLSASIWSSNIATALGVARQMQTGLAWVNCWLVRDLRAPFGGVKESGLGREGGFEALKFFTESKSICISNY